MSAIESIL